MIQITLFIEGEKVLVQIPANTRVGDLPNFVQGLPTGGAFRVGGQAANAETPLKAGQTVQRVPDAGRLG